MRLGAAIASVSTLLYKYHKFKKEHGGTVPEDFPPGLQRIIEPLDERLGGIIERSGNAFPLIAAGLLAGPHVTKFSLDFMQEGKVSVSSGAVAAGYLMLVAYLTRGKMGQAGTQDIHPGEVLGRLAEQM